MNKGGYNVKVKSQGTIPASYYCPHCKKLFKSAVQTTDGDRLCNVCFEEIVRMPNHTCRDCHLTVNPSERYPDMANRKEISRVTVLCDNEDQGCPWTGQLSELEAHLAQCQFKKVQCGVCFEFVLLSYLDQHKKEECPLREINCDYCNAVVVARELQTHFGCCQLYPVKCKQCQKTVQRKQLEPQFRRSQVPMAGKENDDVLELRKEIRELRSFMEAIHSRLSKLEDGKNARNYDVPPSAKEFVPLEMMKSELGVNQKLKFLEDKILEVEKTTNILSVHHSELELQLQESLASTHTGEFMWRIPDVQRRIREAKLGRVSCINSPPFYTGKTEFFKMCIRCYLNGDGMGEGLFLSLFIVIMKGEHDALLVWPFDSKVSLMLIDQDRNKHVVQTFKPSPSSSSFLRPKNDMNVASGCPQFAPLDVLQNTSYVKDDVMFIRCKCEDKDDEHDYPKSIDEL